MKKICIRKAQPVLKGKPVESLQIELAHEIEDFNPSMDWQRAYQEQYENDAKTLADALINTLPGGTLHQLLIELLKHKVSLLVIQDKTNNY